MATSLSTLFSNLQLLRQRYPGLHRRMSRSLISSVTDNLYRDEDGSYAYLIDDSNNHKILVKERKGDVNIEGKKIIILLGVGLGYQLFKVFEKLEDDQFLIAIESRADLICKSMYVHDWEGPLNSPQVKLMIGADHQGLNDLAARLSMVRNGSEIAVLDNKVLVTVDQKIYAWWNAYFYLVAGLGYDGIRVINYVMSRFNIWDPDNLFLNMPSEFLGLQISELEPEQILGRLRLLADIVEPGVKTLRLDRFEARKEPPPPEHPGRVTVVLLSWNNVDYTRRCLDSLLNVTDYPDFNIIVVDNGSKDGTGDMLLELAKRESRINPILCDTNHGIPAGRQIGFKSADGEYVLFLDNDTEIVREDFMQILVKTINSHSNIGAAGAFPVVYTSDTTDSYIQCVHIPGMAVPVAWLSTYCMMVRTAALNDIGGIDTEGFAAYGSEDVYLSYKLREHGWIVSSTPDLVGVTHHIQHRENNYDYDWNATGKHNRELFFKRFGPRRRLLNAAIDNRIDAGRWDSLQQKFLD